MQLDDLDFFLLDSVSGQREKLKGFAASHAAACPHTREELVAHLLDLEQAGHLEVRIKGRLRYVPIRPTADELHAGICGALPLSFGLTTKGCDQWAKLRRVDWEHWVQVDYGTSITARTRRQAEFWLEVFRRWDGDIVTDVSWRTLFPWRIFPWHHEAVGHRASFQSELDFQRYVGLPQRPSFRRKWERTPAVACRRACTPTAPERLLEDLPHHTVNNSRFRSRQVRQRLAGGMELLHRGVNLIGELQRPGAVERYVGARSAVSRNDRDAVPELLRAAFTYGDIAAIEALGAMGDPASEAPLRMLLQYQTQDSVVAAIRCALEGREPPTDVENPAGATWTSRAGQETCPTPDAASGDWKARLNAVRLLQPADTEEGQAQLAQLRDDPDIIVSGCARWAL